MSNTQTAIVTVDVNQAVDVIKNSNGKFMTVSFIKRSNNELRTMNCRTGVTKGIIGGRGKAKKATGLITIYDMTKHEWRNINISGLREVRVDGIVYKVN